jgi:cysteine-rich repeat protein
MYSKMTKVLIFMMLLSLSVIPNVFAQNGAIILQPVDMHFELVDAGLPTVLDVDKLVFTGIEYRNTSNDVAPIGVVSVGDSSEIDGVLGISSFVDTGGIQVIPPGFNITWEMTGTYVDLMDTVTNTFITAGVGIFTLYVSTDMAQQANFNTGDGFDDGTIVGQFLVVEGGGGSYSIAGAFDGSRDFLAIKQSGVAGFFDPDISAVSFDSNLDADPDDNGVGGNDPIPTNWQYDVGTPEINFPLNFYATVDGSLRFGFIPECNVDIEKLVAEIGMPPFNDADQCTDADVPVIQVPGGAMYQLIVENTTGVDTILTECTITDTQLGIVMDIGTLEFGQPKTFTGSGQPGPMEIFVPELSVPNRCQEAAPLGLSNTATITCLFCFEGEVLIDENVSDSDDACVICEPGCGDGIVTPPETCEPPGSNAGQPNECRDDCTFCGDGNLDSGEQCDDGNNVDGDGCSANCTDEGICGTGTPGYWKNHPEAWPVESIMVDGVLYPKDEAIFLMGKDGSGQKGNKCLTMYRSLVAAKLNILNGCSGSCVTETIAAADEWMDDWCVDNIPMCLTKRQNNCLRVDGDSSAWDIGEPLYWFLDRYNNGLECDPSRDYAGDPHNLCVPPGWPYDGGGTEPPPPPPPAGDCSDYGDQGSCDNDPACKWNKKKNMCRSR